MKALTVILPARRVVHKLLRLRVDTFHAQVYQASEMLLFQTACSESEIADNMWPAPWNTPCNEATSRFGALHSDTW